MANQIQFSHWNISMIMINIKPYDVESKSMISLISKTTWAMVEATSSNKPIYNQLTKWPGRLGVAYHPIAKYDLA